MRVIVWGREELDQAMSLGFLILQKDLTLGKGTVLASSKQRLLENQLLTITSVIYAIFIGFAWIRDGRITVRLLTKYLMKKLELDSESEVAGDAQIEVI
ncbi:hypothetical protein Bca52824_013956 [Brassica carinata]|uniref:Uncharacterized protein n=1 Tax=Brassica carinata TaxID=52824 RepID=A0A8X7W1R0_BRACI|nr:hypothetical protein Bca52824_013956 [Brassica carinata]